VTTVTETPDRAERRRRREALRRAHPDAGGDPAEFARLVRLLDPRAAPGPAGDEVRFVRRPRGLARVPAWCRTRLDRRRRPPRVL
jgi:hypothetical protein